MNLKYEDKRVLTLEIEADLLTGYDEITPFVSAIKKISEKAKRPGFVREFSKNERIVLKGLWDEMKPYDAVKEGNSNKAG